MNRGERLLDIVDSWRQECGTGTACEGCLRSEQCDKDFEDIKEIFSKLDQRKPRSREYER